MALKALVRKYWSKQGLKSQTEQFFLGGFPDVILQDHSQVVECGTTNPNAVLLYLSDSIIEKVGILPYPFEGEAYLKIHWFNRGKNFGSYSATKKKYLKKNPRKISSEVMEK